MGTFLVVGCLFDSGALTRGMSPAGAVRMVPGRHSPDPQPLRNLPSLCTLSMYPLADTVIEYVAPGNQSVMSRGARRSHRACMQLDTESPGRGTGHGRQIDRHESDGEACRTPGTE